MGAFEFVSNFEWFSNVRHELSQTFAAALPPKNMFVSAQCVWILFFFSITLLFQNNTN